jgi:hypothetical protein
MCGARLTEDSRYIDHWGYMTNICKQCRKVKEQEYVQSIEIYKEGFTDGGSGTDCDVDRNGIG